MGKSADNDKKKAAKPSGKGTQAKPKAGIRLLQCPYSPLLELPMWLLLLLLLSLRCLLRFPFLPL